MNSPEMKLGKRLNLAPLSVRSAIRKRISSDAFPPRPKGVRYCVLLVSLEIGRLESGFNGEQAKQEIYKKA
jgi:hypothetical protein